MEQQREQALVARSSARALEQHLGASWAELVHAHGRVVAQAPGFGPALTGVTMLNHVVKCMSASLRLCPDKQRSTALRAFKARHRDIADLRGILTHIEEYHVGSGSHAARIADADDFVRIHGLTFFDLSISGDRWTVRVGGGTVISGAGREVSPPEYAVNVGAATLALAPLYRDHALALRRFIDGK